MLCCIVGMTMSLATVVRCFVVLKICLALAISCIRKLFSASLWLNTMSTVCNFYAAPVRRGGFFIVCFLIFMREVMAKVLS